MTGCYNSPTLQTPHPMTRCLPRCAGAHLSYSIPLQLSIKPPQSPTLENGGSSSSPLMAPEYLRIPGLIHSPGPRPTSLALPAGMTYITKTWTRGRSRTYAICRVQVSAASVRWSLRRVGFTLPLEPRLDPYRSGIPLRVVEFDHGRIPTG